MIGCLIAALALSGPSVIELPDPEANYITLQVIVKIGAFSGKEQALAEVVNDTLLDATQDFNEDQIREFSTETGEAMRCTLSADHYRLQLEVPKGQMDLAGEIIADVLQHPRFDPDVLAKELEGAQVRQLSFWAEVLEPFKLDYKKITRDQVVAFFSKTFVPSATTITIGGAFASGDGKDTMAKYLADWTEPKPVPTYGRIKLPEPPPGLLAKHTGPVSTIELYGPEYSPSNFALQLMVATALGVGKGSAMHQVLREKLGLSYEQVAFVEPTPAGFRTHLLMVRTPSDQDINLLGTVRDALLADVKNWNEGTRLRALGMARSYLQNQTAADPLFLDSHTILGVGLEERTFLQGYWQMKTGQAWDTQKLLATMDQVTVDQLKAEALNLLNAAQGSVVEI